MYDSHEDWHMDFEKCVALGNKFQEHKDVFSKSSQGLLQALKDRDELYRLASHLYVFTHMKLDEDTRHSESQELSDKGLKLIVQTNEKTSFLIPEILTIDDEKLEAFFKENEALEIYGHFIDDIVRQGEHTLSPREEL